MQARIAVAEMLNLQLLYRFNDRRRNEMHIIVDPRQRLERVEQQRTGSAKQRRRFAGDDTTVGKLHRRGGRTRTVRLFLRGGDDRTVLRLSLIHILHALVSADDWYHCREAR